MRLQDIMARAGESITVERVFGTPIEKDGLTIVPVAAVRGGGGGGTGGGAESAGGEGSGGGFGVDARPVGVYVIRNGGVEWQEATDSGRVMLGWQVVAVAIVFMLKTMAKQRAKTKRRRA